MVPFILVGLIISIITYLNKDSIISKNKSQIDFIKDISDLQGDDFCLYLRSFDDDKFESSQVQRSWLFPMGTPKYTIDIKIYNQLKGLYPILKITNVKNGNQPYGSSQLDLGDDWKNNVLHLMQMCKYIIIKPSETQGLLWELDQIFNNNYIQKTIFIGIYSDSDLKEVEKIKRKRFHELLKSRFNVISSKRPFYIASGQLSFFTIRNSAVDYRSCYNLRGIIKYIEE